MQYIKGLSQQSLPPAPLLVVISLKAPSSLVVSLCSLFCLLWVFSFHLITALLKQNLSQAGPSSEMSVRLVRFVFLTESLNLVLILFFVLNPHSHVTLGSGLIMSFSTSVNTPLHSSNTGSANCWKENEAYKSLETMTCFNTANSYWASSALTLHVSVGFQISLHQRERKVRRESSVSFIYPEYYIPALHVIEGWAVTVEVEKLVSFKRVTFRDEELFFCRARVDNYSSQGLFCTFIHPTIRMWGSPILVFENVLGQGSHV